MFGLSQLLKTAGALAWRLHGNWLREPRKPIRKASLQFETLEERTVPTLLGQNLFPADYAWNQNIANAPVAANSATIMANIGSSISVHPDWGNANPANTSPLYGIPVNIVHGNTAPRVNFVVDNYPTESDLLSVPMPANPVIEGDWQNGPNMNGPGYGTNQRGDSHLLIWDQDNNIGYELYGVARPNDPMTFTGASTGGVWHAAQESVWNMTTNQFRSLGETSADAAGLSIIAGLARPDEGLPVSQGGQGVINHAIRFTLPSGRINPQYVYPASHMVYTTSGSANVPLGAHFRLKNDAATNAKIALLGPQAQIIARAMQQYGLILADIGSPMYITGASATYNPNNGSNLVWNMDDVLGLQNIKSGDFEVLDLSPRVTGLSSASAAPGSTISVFGTNFSGAAGRLSVNFGTVAATSVTYVSDTQLNVVVPNSTGAVHVQVQSGINAVDPNGQNHNATAPIHGYGKSAATSADSFTFSTGTTISGANSTASFAAPTVASGAGDVLTIAIKDTLGNAVGGLASSAFSFTWSGGTSTGTLSAVNQTATQGTYSTTFTGALAGSTATLTITVGGVTLAVQPTITVNAAAVNAATSTAAFATNTVASGGDDLLTIRVKDAAGNPITGLTSSAFGFALSGGTSTGAFSTVSATATAGTYIATFTAAQPGSTSTVAVTVAGTTLSVQPTITVTQGAVSATASTANFSTPIVASGSADPLTIVVKDAAGNAITGLSDSAFSFSLSGGTSTGTFSSVSATATAGTYTATFTGVLAGTASTLAVTVGGVTLSFQPTITVTPGSINASTSTATFATPTVGVGGADLVTIRIKDAAGNAISGVSSSAFGLSLFGGTSAGTFSSVSETATPGTYSATFTGTTLGSASSLAVVVNGILLNAQPTVAVASATTFGDDFSTAGDNQQLDSAWTTLVGGFVVNTSAHTATGTGTLNLATVNGISNADEAVFANISVSNGQTAALVARHNGPGDRNMYIAVVAGKSSSYTVSLYRNVNGSWTQLTAKSFSGSVNNAAMEFDVVGSSLRVFMNGTIVAFANDYRLTSPGSIGMRTKGGATMMNFASTPLTSANQSTPFTSGFSNAGSNGQLSNAWLNRAGNIGIVNGAAVGIGDINLATVNGINAADVTVQADISLTGKGQVGGLVTRYSGVGDQNMYFVRVAQTSANNFNVALCVNVNGTWRTIKSQAVSSGTGTLRLSMVGNQMTVSWGGSTLFSVVDSSISLAGGVGLRLRSGATADNFSVS